MKAFLLTTIAILVVALLGWVSIENSSDQTVIKIDKQEAVNDTKEAVKSIENATKDVGKKVKKATSGDESTEASKDNESEDEQP